MQNLYKPKELSEANRHMNTQLLYISHSKYGNDWSGQMHSHYFTEIFYIISGRGQLNLTGGAQQLVQNDIVIINSNVEHTETGDGSSPMEYIVIGISGLDFLFNKDCDCRYIILNNENNRDKLLFYFNLLMNEMKTQNTGYTVICRSLIDILIIKLNRQLKFSIAYTEQKMYSSECKIIKNYINQHYTEDISLDLLAKIAHISKYHLAHSFKRENGISPINYLIQRRIDESKHLLSTTNFTISYIAYNLGFSSPSYFSQCFKRTVNMSPNEYRRINRK